MEALEVKNMTVFEARECVKQINENIHNVRALLLDLYERKGWEALGYESWRACAVGEFKGKENYLYKQLAAAKAEKNICTMVQNSEPIPERVLRPLTSLPPEEQREIYQEAQETAPDGKVTAKHIEEVIANREEVNQLELDEESYNLTMLKRFWNASSKRDRRSFLDWLQTKQN